MNIHKSAEDYLEEILIISKKQNHVRAIDIATELGFSKASVSIALKKLRENGYIVIDSNQYITLTDKGFKIADNIYERHTLLANLLIGIGVSEEQAYIDACKIEHDISNETFEALKNIKRN